MQTQIRKISRNNASVLLVSIVITAILGFTLASYLYLVETQSKSVARSQIWNNAMIVTEAGVEDALQLLNKYKGGDDLDAWTTTYAADGWAKNGNVYSVTRFMDAAKTTYYTVWITNNLSTPTIRSFGNVPKPAAFVSKTPVGFLAVQGVQVAAAPLARSVQVQTKKDALFNVCMAALGAIDLKGNNVASDSFDSADIYNGIWNVNGYYTNTLRKAGGDIVTNNTFTNSVLNVGNADIGGKVITGPLGSITIGANGTVGDIPWIEDAANNGKIKPGWSANDLNVVFQDVTLPTTTWNSAAGAGTGGSATINGKNYDHVFSYPGDYSIADNGTIYVGTNVHVRLNITVSTFKPNYIYVAGKGAFAGKMTAYLSGQNATLGTEHMTQSGKAENLAFLGLPTCKDIAYKGNGDFTGVIYAPQADFQLAGGGSGYIDFIGSSVTKTVQMNGHYHFHYDENLKKVGPNNGYIATTWREVTSN
jgi:hypothetical protein